jgi:hypothetical protein
MILQKPTSSSLKALQLIAFASHFTAKKIHLVPKNSSKIF